MPYYEREIGGSERRLGQDDRVSLGSGREHISAGVFNDWVFVNSPRRFPLYKGDFDSETGGFKELPERMRGNFVVKRQSISNNSRSPQIIWKER